MAEVLNQPVVIDNGTGIIKAGFAGADKPKVCDANSERRLVWHIPSLVAAGDVAVLLRRRARWLLGAQSRELGY